MRNMRGGWLLLFSMLVILTGCFFVGSRAVMAQSTSAGMSGQVLDPVGAAVQGASVVAVNDDTGVKYPTKTNSEGFYSLTGLPPGKYHLEISKAGFKTIVQEGIVLHLQETRSSNSTLQLGEVSETVMVQGGGININTTDGTVSTLVDSTMIENMPLNGRTLQDLIMLTPGVNGTSAQSLGALGSPSARGTSGEFSVNGQRTESNYYTVDGVSSNTGLTPAGYSTQSQALSFAGSTSASTSLGTTQALVSVDDLQEFRVQSSSYSAQFGRSPGGQFDFQTKSGTNTWHGDAYDYLRNSAVGAANDWFTNYYGASQPELQQNDFGGALGGPVRIPGLYNGKDKTFFFANYEGLRANFPQQGALYNVPDDCMRGISGPTDCAALNSNPTYTSQPNWPATGRNPAGSQTLNQNTMTLSPNPNGNPGLLALVNAFALPNRGELDAGDGPGVDGVAGFASAFSNAASINSYSIRLDQVINDKMTVFFRFSDTNSDSQSHVAAVSSSASGEPTIITTAPTLIRTYTFGASNIFSPALSNDLRVNYTTNEGGVTTFQVRVNGSVPVNLASLMGMPASSSEEESAQFRLGNATMNLQQGTPLFNTDSQWNIVDTVSYTVGAHQFKFGVDYRRLVSVLQQQQYSAGYGFQNETDVEAANVEMEALTFTQASNAYPLFKNFSAFAQDTWKVSPRLTLDFGLRWELNPPAGVTQGQYPYTLVGTGVSTSAPWAPACTNGPYMVGQPCTAGIPQYATTWFNFAPRLGAAYVLRNAPRWQTVLRGGFGVFYDTGQQLDSVAFNGTGYSGTLVNQNPATFPVTPTFSGVSASLFQNNAIGYAPHLQLPYTLQWNTSIEQQLGKAQALTVSYVGSHGSRLLEENEYNNLGGGNPNANSFFFIQNGLTSDYDALQSQFQRQLSHDLTVLASYTWSHCEDWGSVNFLSGYTRGDCDFDIRQSFSVAVSYNLPNVQGNSILKAILDHWGIDDRFTAHTAPPIFMTGAPSLDMQTGQSLPSAYDIVLNANGQPLPDYLYGAACATFYKAVFQSLGTKDVCPGGKAINPCAFYPAGPGGIYFPLCPQSPRNPHRPNQPVIPVSEIGGPAPRNVLRGFGVTQMDVALRREFPIHERLKLQLRAEAFNVFNHPNFGFMQTAGDQMGLATATLAGSSGVLASQYSLGGPRVLQFALKLIF